MAKHRGISRHVFSLTHLRYVERGQVESRIGKTAQWVDRGKTFRELTLPEVLALRAAQSESAQPSHTPYRDFANELPGLIFQPPAKDKFKFRERMPLLRTAAELLSQYA